MIELKTKYKRGRIDYQEYEKNMSNYEKIYGGSLEDED